MICVSRVGEHISPVIIASVCFPTQETHVTRDMCSGEHVSRETTYDSDITDMCYPKHISLVKFVSPTREHIHCITSDMCFLGRGNISLQIYVSRGGEHMAFLENISPEICVPRVGERISLGICVSRKREHIHLVICVVW